MISNRSTSSYCIRAERTLLIKTLAAVLILLTDLSFLDGQNEVCYALVMEVACRTKTCILRAGQ